jgi:hypothetical protein
MYINRWLYAKQLIADDCRRYEHYNGFVSVLKRFLLYPAFKVLFFHRVINSFGWGGKFRISTELCHINIL